MTDRGYAHFSLGEVRAHASATTPLGILSAIVGALKFHGVDASKIHGVDIDKLAEQFEAIDARAFEKLLSAAEFAPLQLAAIEATERTGKGVISRRDPGTRLGHIAA